MRTTRALILLLIIFFSNVLPIGAADPPPQGHLIGIWRAHVDTPWGPGLAETILMPNGSFNKTFRAGDLMTWDVGKFSTGPGYIHFTIEDHEPKIYKGKPMSWPKSETVFYQMLGPDRMACEDRITGGRWEAFRAR
jgi:hypothetical protein